MTTLRRECTVPIENRPVQRRRENRPCEVGKEQDRCSPTDRPRAHDKANYGDDHGQGVHKRCTNIVSAEHQPRPRGVQYEVQAPDPKTETKSILLPHQPSGNGNHEVENAPRWRK